jgi:hypothetical protein
LQVGGSQRRALQLFSLGCWETAGFPWDRGPLARPFPDAGETPAVPGFIRSMPGLVVAASASEWVRCMNPASDREMSHSAGFAVHFVLFCQRSLPQVHAA